MSDRLPEESITEWGEKLDTIDQVCDEYDELDENNTNSTRSDDSSSITVEDALSNLNDVFPDDVDTLDSATLVRNVSAILPNFSKDDTISEVCSKANQSRAVWNAFDACPMVAGFHYNPTHCDPGYWCGCWVQSSIQQPDRCFPSNETTNPLSPDYTTWAGHYTEIGEIDPKTNKSKTTVFIGLAHEYPNEYFKCNNTLYCPGKLSPVTGNATNSTTSCPELCKKGYYCPDPTQQFKCPVGSYCKIGSTSPTPCTGLERCIEEGIDSTGKNLDVIIVVIIALGAFGCVVGAYRYLTKLWPFQIRANNDIEDTAVRISNISTTNSKQLVRHSIANGEVEDKLMRKKSMITLPKPSYTIDVKFNCLQRTLPNGICIMQGVTGELKGGQFTAIMGPSGAGKSTFLSLLSGKTEPTGGTLAVNGDNSSLKEFRELVGFVPQEDIMLRELTVEENIQHSAMMRLPTKLSHKQKIERVFKVMESLDLVHIRNNIIGDEIVRGISGGQRKRVNVAMELVADPSLLALDEPTSGLDSTTSSKLCETLCQLAFTGVNVMAVIHQPKMEILNLFTHVLLLGVGGKTVFFGLTGDLTAYFTGIGFPLPAQTNPADYYMDVIAGLIPCVNSPDFVKEDLFDLWNNSPQNRSDQERKNNDNDDCDNTKTIAERVQRKVISFFRSLKFGQQKYRTTPGVFRQTYLLFKRAILQRCRGPKNTGIPLILSVAGGCLIGFFAKHGPTDGYYGIPLVSLDPFKASFHFMDVQPYNPLSTVWMITAMIAMLVCIGSMSTFGSEKAVSLRDSFSGTNPTSYWLAKTLEASIWLPLHSAVYITVQSAIYPLPIDMPRFWIVVWMLMLGYTGVGHTVSLLIGSKNGGIVYVIVGLLLTLIFSGGQIPLTESGFKTLFFTYWTAQGYQESSLVDYREVFDVDILNEARDKFNFEFTLALNMIYAALTALLWHFIVLIIIIFQLK